jgi:hypothetical protein
LFGFLIISFHFFHVDPEKGGIEEIIVTTTGNLVVSWKFRNVTGDYKNGRLLYATEGQGKIDRKANIEKLDSAIQAHAFEHLDKTRVADFALENQLKQLKLE